MDYSIEDVKMVYEDYYQRMIDKYLKIKGIDISGLDPDTAKWQKYTMAISELSKSEEYQKRLREAKAENFTNDVYEDADGEEHEYLNEYKWNYLSLMSEVDRIEYEKSLSFKFSNFISDSVTLIREKMQSKKRKIK